MVASSSGKHRTAEPQNRPMLTIDPDLVSRMVSELEVVVNHSCDTPYVGTAETALTVVSSATMLLRQS